MKFSLAELLFIGAMGALLAVSATLYLWNPTTLPSDSATLISGFGGAVLGSTISALVSFLLAARTAKDALERDTAQRLDIEKAKIASLMIKASLILSDVVAIKRHIEESLQQANERKLTHLPRWARVLPTVGNSQTFDVVPDELAPIIRAKNSDMLNAIVTMTMQHRNLIEAVHLYGEKRGALKDITDMHEEAGPGILNSRLTRAQVGKLAPLGIELQSLLRGIEERLPFIEKLAEKVTLDLGPAMKTYLGADDIPVFARADSDGEQSGHVSADGGAP